MLDIRIAKSASLGSVHTSAVVSSENLIDFKKLVHDRIVMVNMTSTWRGRYSLFTFTIIQLSLYMVAILIHASLQYKTTAFDMHLQRHTFPGYAAIYRGFFSMYSCLSPKQNVM